jgi:hypothetical protein
MMHLASHSSVVLPATARVGVSPFGALQQKLVAVMMAVVVGFLLNLFMTRVDDAWKARSAGTGFAEGVAEWASDFHHPGALQE